MTSQQRHERLPTDLNARRGAIIMILGLLMVFAAVYSIGVTAAIAWPSGLSGWARENGLLTPFIFVWKLIVEYGVGIGILCLGLQLILYRWVIGPSWKAAGLFLLAALIGLYLLAPLVYQYPMMAMFRRFALDWTLELVLLITTLLALWISRPKADEPAAADSSPASA